MARDKEYRSMINSAKWVKLRRNILTANPLCVDCKKENLITPATEVHHIRPVEEAFTRAERTRRMFDKHNLCALCHNCHVKRHVELGRSGKEATKKRNEKQVREIINIFFAD